MLKNQLNTFFDKYSFLVKWHLLEVVLGRVLFAHVLKGQVYCSDDGNQWLHSSFPGALFMILHILGTMQSMGMSRKIFVKDPLGEKDVKEKKAK